MNESQLDNYILSDENESLSGDEDCQGREFVYNAMHKLSLEEVASLDPFR